MTDEDPPGVPICKGCGREIFGSKYKRGRMPESRGWYCLVCCGKCVAEKIDAEVEAGRRMEMKL